MAEWGLVNGRALTGHGAVGGGLAGSVAESATSPVRVQMWPRWVANPYLPSLISSLQNAGVEAGASPLLYLGARRLRAGDWLHLHWPGETHLHGSRSLYRLRAAAIRLRLKALKRRGVRIAWTANNLVPHDDPHPNLGRQARRDLLAVADHVFVHFEGAREQLAEAFGYRGPCTTVHHPHYIGDYQAPPPRAEARAQFGIPADGFVALAFGRIRPYKGVGNVIEAFQRVAGEQDRLIIAGPPQGDVSAELGIAAGDSRIILHAKHIPDEEVPVYYGAADVAVLGQRAFFTSGSAVLALSMGRPVVGPTTHHLSDLAGGQRVFAVETTVDGLATGLAQARAAAPTIDHDAVRAWASHYGTWQDAAIRTASVLRS
ncbi:glycosyltransferase [Mycolicibacterium sp. J2]|uniref:glycosyltransferase n=1 Tax=Mycolicibacterium sp. J2 TaxID=2993511 RepID=UPI00224B7F05|nr:glycosyltransferase [Mycolicibacterium sp. J2]MCX2713506.1 glycosyltransferase [Mycolicibacterium sp. J2]